MTIEINDKADEFSSDDLALIGDDQGADTQDKPADGKGAPTDADKGAEVGKDKPSDTPSFGDDWRDKLVLGLPADQHGKAKDYLKTRGSPYEVLRAGMAADAKINELKRDRVKIPTGKDDDPKEVSAYRKAMGIPEKADDYKVTIPDEYGDLTELDEELKGEALKSAHEVGASQKHVDWAFKTHFAIHNRMLAEQAQRVAKSQQAAVDELRVEYGKEYRGNVELVNRMFEKELGEVGMTDAAKRTEFLSQRFSNGMALGEHPAFVKMMVKIARERADDGALEMGESEGVDVDAKIENIMGKLHTDRKEYERLQPELQKLIAAKNRRAKRG